MAGSSSSSEPAAGPAAVASDERRAGHVVGENNVPVRAARLTVCPAAGAAKTLEAETDATGVFTLTVPEPGEYLISVEREGYYALKDRPGARRRRAGSEVGLRTF